MKRLKVPLLAIAAFIAVSVLAGLGFLYAGGFNVAADEAHWGLTYRLLESTREASIAARARDVKAPALNDPQLLAMGAEHYEEMCTGCHLAPGKEDTEIRAGLYPKPPNLVEHGAHRSAGETFWIIKHGLKMTGMPAWGITHDDQSIWSMVAFLQKLPELSQAQYEELVAQGRAAGHTHGDDESGHSHADPAMPSQDQEADGHEHSEGGEDHAHDGAGAGAKSAEESKPQQHEHDDGHSHTDSEPRQ